jgi:predicted nucleic acid-binding protein
MLVVSNTSPILNLAIVDQLELLRQQFGEILIPHALLDELKVTGILGILLRAKQLGELESLQSVVDNLINKAEFRIAPELLTQILTQ